MSDIAEQPQETKRSRKSSTRRARPESPDSASTKEGGTPSKSASADQAEAPAES